MIDIGLQFEIYRILLKMLRPVISLENCLACHPCAARKVCNTRAIVKIDHDEPPYIAIERCNGCALCIPACIFEAIVMVNSGTAVGGGCGGIRLGA
jgi:Pyruvate/2-oxoacid:ferredoxin oxidoreductase delta subunit